MPVLNYIQVNVEQRSPEWHKFRQWKIGASMAPIIMQESPWETPQQLYCRILNGIEIEDNADMQRGRLLESEALKHYPTAIPACFESVERPWQICSLDGWIEEEDLIIEIKCPRRFSKQDVMGKKYYAQLQHQMSVMSTDRCLYVEYVDGKLAYEIVRRDEEYIEKLVIAEKDFHDRLMTFSRPPHESDSEWSKFI